jgi:LuxR family transcriptional regulator, maltose regulon positive regulatory protein
MTIPRIHVLELLDAARDSKLIALVAPSGYGKTTALAQWVRVSSLQVTAWLTLESKDTNPAQLAQSIRASLHHAIPDWALPTLDETTHSFELILEYAKRLARSLDGLDQNLRLIVDGVEALGVDAAHWLEGLISSLSEGHQIVLTGFEPFPIQLGLFSSQTRVTIVETNALSFSPEESESYLTARGFTGNRKEVFERLHGWPAGLAVAAVGHDGHSRIDELVRQYLNRLPPPIGELLPEMSLAEHWSALTAAQFGVAMPDGWLDTVRRTGLPLTPLGRGVFRPHQMILDVLNEVLQERSSRCRELTLRAAALAEQKGDLFSALQYFRDLGEKGEVLRLTERLLSRFETRWSYQHIVDALSDIDISLMSDRLAVAFGNALVRVGEVTRGNEVLRELKDEGRGSADLFFALGAVATLRGRPERTLSLALEGLPLAGTPLLRNRLMRLQADALLRLGRYAQASEVCQEAVEQALNLDDSLILAKSLADLSRIQSRLTPDLAIGTIYKALSAFEDAGFELGKVALYDELATLHCMKGKTQEALNCIDRGMSIVKREGGSTFKDLLQTRGDIRIWCGQYQEALLDFQAALDSNTSVKNRISEFGLRYKIIEVARRAYRDDIAESTKAELKGMIAPDFPAFVVAAKFYEGLEAFSNGAFIAAQKLFEFATGEGAHPQMAARAHAYLAASQYKINQLSFQQVQTWLSSVDFLGADAVLGVDVNILSDLYRYCVVQGWFPERFQAFLDQPTNITVLELSNNTLLLEVQTLGAFRVTIAGIEVKLPNKKARELLTWLVLEGVSTRERLVDALWDGSDESRHVEYFKVTARRLRASLAEHPSVSFNPLVFERDRYMLSSHFSVHCDVKTIQSALEVHDSESLSQALALYQGSFLEGCDTEWVETIRQNTLENVINTALILGRIHSPSAVAHTAYRKALAIDPLCADAHRELIRSLNAAGERGAAQIALQTYSRMLENEFNEQPERELTQLFS